MSPVDRITATSSVVECGERYSTELRTRATPGSKSNLNKIVGSKDARRGDFPWIAAIYTVIENYLFLECGGSVICKFDQEYDN